MLSIWWLISVCLMGHIFRPNCSELDHFATRCHKNAVHLAVKCSSPHLSRQSTPYTNPTTNQHSSESVHFPRKTTTANAVHPSYYHPSSASRATIVVLHWSHAINMSGLCVTDFSWVLPSFFKLINLLSGDCNNLNNRNKPTVLKYAHAVRRVCCCCLFLPSFRPIKISHVCIAAAGPCHTMPPPPEVSTWLLPMAVCLGAH